MATGTVDVDGMLAGMSSTQFTEWLAYNSIDPIGEWRADLRAGIIASTIAEVNRDGSKRSQSFKASDFMPVFEPLPKKQEEHTLTTLKDKILRAFGLRKGERS